MEKVIIILVLAFLAAAALFGATSDAPEVASNNQTQIEMYRIQMEATIAAATPTTGQVLALNRQSLYDTSGTADNGSVWVGWAIFLGILLLAGLGVVALQSMSDPMKQLRLIFKELHGGSRSRRSLPSGRMRTIPTLGGGQDYRYLPPPAPTEQMAQEVESEF